MTVGEIEQMASAGVLQVLIAALVQAGLLDGDVWNEAIAGLAAAHRDTGNPADVMLGDEIERFLIPPERPRLTLVESLPRTFSRD